MGHAVQGLRRWAASLTPSRRADSLCLPILVEERLSSFALPHIGAGGVGVYRLVATAFGPYSMLSCVRCTRTVPGVVPGSRDADRPHSLRLEPL
jgi:hypothetical protein